MPQYQGIVFLSGDDYDQMVTELFPDLEPGWAAPIDTHVEEVTAYLAQWDYGDENGGEITEFEPWGTSDDVFPVPDQGYTLSVNTGLGYVSLTRVTETVPNAFTETGQDVEYTVEVPLQYAREPEWETPLTIGLSVLGGGTVGVEYPHAGWVWGLWSGEELILSATDLKSNAIGATHEVMARSLGTFLASDGETMYHGGEVEFASFTSRQREILEGEYERLAAFAYEGTAYAPHYRAASGSFNMSVVGDAIVRDVCAKPIAPMDRLLLSDALCEFEREVALESFEGSGMNDVALGEYLADNAGRFADDAPRLPRIINQLRAQYGYEE